MTDVSLKYLAKKLNLSLDYLIKQLFNAGLNKSQSDNLSLQEQENFLEYLNKNKFFYFPPKLSIKRKRYQKLTITNNRGKSKTIKIEIRKTQTYIPHPPYTLTKYTIEQIKREQVKPHQAPAEPAEPAAPAEPAVNQPKHTPPQNESRAPVVTIMGHVDHGKTTVLDYIRSTNIASSEAGGITQHIGAYNVKTENGMITFIDTPGHSAFSAMRARGTQITDIIILIIAADDGIMPQTIEAINHAKIANVPIIVAINKIDKLGANPEKIKNELTKHGIVSEEWGGDCQFVNISAKTGSGIDNLLNAILLQAEILELKAIYNNLASGVVIESSLDKGRGPIATILIQEGTLKKGNIVLCGLEYGRVRAMRNELGLNINSAGPSIPVEIIGLSGVPVAGDKLMVVNSEKEARYLANSRLNKLKEHRLSRSSTGSFWDSLNKDSLLELNIILKSNVQGTIEAIVNTLEKLSTNKIKVKIISFGVGGFTDTDISLAIASKAILIGFNISPDVAISRMIETENLYFRTFSVIYDLVNDVQKVMNNMLSPEPKLKIIGLAEIINIFSFPNIGVIAGCMVLQGIVKRNPNTRIRILRKNSLIYEGELESLRRFQSDVNEVRSGLECGISMNNFKKFNKGDIIQVIELIKND